MLIRRVWLVRKAFGYFAGKHHTRNEHALYESFAQFLAIQIDFLFDGLKTLDRQGLTFYE